MTSPPLSPAAFPTTLTPSTVFAPTLLDERSRPDFRSLYGMHASRSVRLDAAVRRVRLGGMDLGTPELGGLERLRLVLGEVDALALSSEAEALAADPGRRGRLALLADLLSRGLLQVRIAPLAGWSPDFSVFHPRSGHPGSPNPRDASSAPSPVLMLGPHWFERPFPHPGPALGVVVTGPDARLGALRFDELWAAGHDLRLPIERILSEALYRTHTPEAVG